MDIVVGEHSHLQYYYLNGQDQRVLHLKRSFVEANASMHWQTAIAKGKAKQISIENHLLGANAHVRHHGLYLGNDNDQIDLRYSAFHHAQHTNSQLEVKGMQYGSSRTRLEGLIYIGPKGAKSDASLKDQSLLLGEKSRHIAIPALDINTDDVKAAHSASTTKVNAAQLFYLQSRGLSKEAAESLIIDGFLESVLACFSDEEFKQQVQSLL
jgi:Fe-S cluster assembly scaffold protein SufB